MNTGHDAAGVRGSSARDLQSATQQLEIWVKVSFVTSELFVFWFILSTTLRSNIKFLKLTKVSPNSRALWR